MKPPTFMSQTDARKSLTQARRIVVKVGSRTLATEPQLPERLADDFKAAVDQGKSIILVSSGATALGIERLGLSTRPTDMPTLQAAASVGQALLMRRYDEAFSRHGLTPAQVLLTHGDLSNRKRVNNARAALAALIEAGAIPIINENDVVATEEIRFSDNDQLAAMVAPLVSADALLLLSDVDGVLDENGVRIPELADTSDFIDHGSSDRIGRGGMASKLDAARKARRSGAAVVIADARAPGILTRVLAGEDVGTCIGAVGERLRARQHWIAFTLKPRGTIVVDQGAARVVEKGTSSLLPVGVIGIRGDFRRGDSVLVVDTTGRELGRGLTRLSALEVAASAGKKGEELAAALGGMEDAVVIHKDDLVVER
jgi:glutamate 5-kinase